jgi:hypothetical protein
MATQARRRIFALRDIGRIATQNGIPESSHFQNKTLKHSCSRNNLSVDAYAAIGSPERQRFHRRREAKLK